MFNSNTPQMPVSGWGPQSASHPQRFAQARPASADKPQNGEGGQRDA